MSIAKEKINAANRKKLFFGVGVAAVILLALFLIFMLVRALMPISSFSVEGITQYSASELAGAGGLRSGERLYSFKEDETEKRILTECPYLSSVDIERGAFGRVTFRVEERSAAWYIELSGDLYVLDTDLYVIEECIYEDILKRGNMTKLTLPDVRRLVSGELIDFGADDNEIIRACEIIVTVNESGLKDRIDMLDMESRFDIKMVIDESYSVYIGDSSDLSAKLGAIKSVLESERAEGTVGGEIDVSNPDVISFKPRY